MRFLKKIILGFLGLQLVTNLQASEVDYYTPKEFDPRYTKVLEYLDEGLYLKALEDLKVLEQEGYVPALYTFYEIYEYAKGVKQDRKKALEYLKRSYEKNYPLAMYEMAIKMLKGDMVPKDSKRGIKILEDMGEDLNDFPNGENGIFHIIQAKANIAVARFYLEGKYIPQDLDKAWEYAYIIGTLPPTQEAVFGRELMVEAYLLAGEVLEAREDRGYTEEQNNKCQALFRYVQAIDLGSLEGYLKEGFWYLKRGRIERAVDAFGVGCPEGCGECCYQAGLLYEKGIMKVPQGENYTAKDVIYDCYKEGAKHGNKKCIEKLKKLKKTK